MTHASCVLVCLCQSMENSYYTITSSTYLHRKIYNQNIDWLNCGNCSLRTSLVQPTLKHLLVILIYQLKLNLKYQIMSVGMMSLLLNLCLPSCSINNWDRSTSLRMNFLSAQLYALHVYELAIERESINMMFSNLGTIARS